MSVFSSNSFAVPVRCHARTLHANHVLSAPTVSNIVDKLIKRGIFNEVSLAPSSGGRPPVLLSIDPKAGYVIGIKLRADGLTTVVCDLDAQVVASRETQASLVGNPAAAIQAIEQAVLRVLRDAVVPQTKVLGVGIGLPGIIDTDRGICNFSHLLWWRDVELAGPLRKRLGLPVWVDNDVNTLAVAEKWAGDAPRRSRLRHLERGTRHRSGHRHRPLALPRRERCGG